MTKEVKNQANQQEVKHQNKVEEDSRLPEELKELFETLPKDEQVKLSQIIYSQHLTTYNGPLPPPSLLREYQEMIPDSPERFLRIVEKEQNHRLSCENKIIGNQIFQNWAGLAIGTALVI